MARRPIRLGPVGATIIGAILEREFQYDPILGSRFEFRIFIRTFPPSFTIEPPEPIESDRSYGQ